MHTPTDFPFHPSEICAFLTQEKQDQIPELVREELISIVSTILAFETYTELE